MIRPFTCVCMVLAGASGLYLYQAKHRVQLLDREITSTIHATETARERIGVLRAEWTLQNDPERLAQLADRFLTLKTVAPGQFTTMAELDKRLPPVRPPPETKPTEPDEDTPIASVPEPEPTTVASIPEPRTEPPRAEPARPEPPRREATAPRPPTAAPPQVKVATAAAPRPPERRHEPVREYASPAPPPPRMAMAETRSVIARAMARLPRPVSPVGAASYVPVAASAPAVTSVLGIARSSIAPPVPYLPQSISNGGG
jgi:hypothetical protein